MSKPIPQDSERRENTRGKVVRVFSSFEEENAAEHRRLAAMTPLERMREFAVLQARRWGESWDRVPIERRASWEHVGW
jgi:hypothetical protein